jgi:hypothetical protein
MDGIKSRAVCSVIIAVIALIGPISRAQAASRSVCKSGCEYTRINAAIEAASPGDTISIAAGTYFENVVVTDKNLTITGTLYKVIVISNLSAKHGAGAGGGIQAIDSNVTILQSIVAHNRATSGQGGGISADRTEVIGSNITITNSDIFDNFALNGGGVYIGPQSTMTMTSSTVTSNGATSGAGAYLGSFRHSAVEETGFLTFNSSTMANNHANDSGGGIYVPNADAGGSFDNSFIVGNRAGTTGGGITLPGGGSLTLTDTILAGNSPNNCSGGEGAICP